VGLATKYLEGRPHLVVPSVLIVTGVLNGTSGRLMYPHSVIARGAKLFNGRYAMLGHPSGQSEYVSGDPDVINNTRLGTVFNSRMVGHKLKADVWLDKERCAALAPEILPGLAQGKTLECSTGLYTEIDPELNGEFQGKRFDATVTNIRGADHLAVFIGNTVGACSVADGCGVGR
jgi:hypothetical protein